MTCDHTYTDGATWYEGSNELIRVLRHTGGVCSFEQYKAVCQRCGHTSSALPRGLVQEMSEAGVRHYFDDKPCRCRSKR